MAFALLLARCRLLLYCSSPQPLSILLWLKDLIFFLELEKMKYGDEIWAANIIVIFLTDILIDLQFNWINSSTFWLVSSTHFKWKKYNMLYLYKYSLYRVCNIYSRSITVSLCTSQKDSCKHSYVIIVLKRWFQVLTKQQPVNHFIYMSV